MFVLNFSLFESALKSEEDVKKSERERDEKKNLKRE